MKGFVQVPGVDEEKPNELFVRFDERAVGDGYLAVADPHRGGGVIALEILGGK